MNGSRVLRVWLWVTGITAVAAFVIFTVYRGFLPSGDITSSSVAPGAYAFAGFWAVLTVAAAVAWVALGIAWLLRRSRRNRV